MSVEVLKQIWPEWQIEGKPLGKGSFGVVYKVARRDHGVESYAAIKVISIPTDPFEVDSLRSEGLDMNATRTYLQGIVNDFVGEIQLMESLKGVQNIVSVEDYKVVEKTGEIGWDIYIRMELLTSFNAYICDKKLTEEEAIKLGCDICTALEICSKRNIIHRDIKPENIFINDFGDFKLGDFGIARKLENMTGGLSQKGTFNYMAPEVANGNEYDARVDTYSLGLVLYRLLNRNRLPFLDTEKQILNPNERRNAVDCRLRGEELPAPCDASPAMANLILRACAYDPNMRFSSATEMKQALMRVADGTYQMAASNLDRTTSVRRALAKYDKTTSVRKAPTASKQKSAPTVNTFGSAPKKKSKMPAAIAIVLTIVLLIGAVYFVTPKLFDGNDSTASSEISSGTSKETSSETTSETVDYSEFDEKEIATIIGEAETLASEENYEGALAKIQTGLATYPKSAELQIKSNEYTSALNAQIKTDALATAETLAQAGDYLEAFNSVDQAISTIGEDEELANKAKEYEDAYVAGVVSQVDTHLENGDFDSADQLVSEALKHFPNNTIIKEQQSRIGNRKPQNLVDVCLPYESNRFSTPDTFTMSGQSYANGFILVAEKDGDPYALFNLQGKYSHLEFDIGHIDESRMYDGAYEIYLDGKYSETIEVSAESLVTHRSIDLKNASQLKIVGNSPDTYIWSTEYGFANAVLFPSANATLINDTNSTPDQAAYLLDVCLPYESNRFSTPDTFTMSGQSYANGFILVAEKDGDPYALFNLQGKYSHLEFDIGHIDESRMYDGAYEIYLDGKYSETIEVSAESLVTHRSIDLKNASQLKIVGNSPDTYIWSTDYGFANVIVY